MKIVARIGAALLGIIGAFLIFAVIAAFTSDEGAKTGVAIAYIAIAAVAGFGAFKLWTMGSSSSSGTTA